MGANEIKNMSNKPTGQKLEEACEDILYGIVALDYACEKCLSPHVNNTDKKFFRDSFIIHFRALYYFYYGKKNKKHPNDLLAKKYLIDNKEFIRVRTKPSSFKDIHGIEYIDKADKQLAHLSLLRREDYLQKEMSGDWPVEDIKTKLDKTTQAFFKYSKKQWFRDAKKPENLPIPPNIKKLYD